MSQNCKIAGVQMDVFLGEKDKNLHRIEESLIRTGEEGAFLSVFPECALTGYCFESIDEARPHAEPVPGPSTLRLARLCGELNQFAIVGALEADGDRIFNACVLLGPHKVLGIYRKVHLPFLGVDRFTSAGDRPFTVHNAGELRVGMNICYDGSFPEASRILALAGADLIVLPTNWPPAADCFADYTINTRAMENHVWYMSVNRVGSERGIEFIGKSRICHPTGKTIASAGAEETILYATIDPTVARNKRLVRTPGVHEINRLGDRRPEFYEPLLERWDGSS